MKSAAVGNERRSGFIGPKPTRDLLSHVILFSLPPLCLVALYCQISNDKTKKLRPSFLCDRGVKQKHRNIENKIRFSQNMFAKFPRSVSFLLMDVRQV